MKELSTDLPSCCYLHEWGYKKFPSSNGILHLYSTGPGKEKETNQEQSAAGHAQE